ncbi:unnamed protein product [Rhizophagus irregularis]|nr:unnamed protein product [Rhizophagus irregularis]
MLAKILQLKQLKKADIAEFFFRLFFKAIFLILFIFELTNPDLKNEMLPDYLDEPDLEIGMLPDYLDEPGLRI